jgi:hypothetical protein
MPAGVDTRQQGDDGPDANLRAMQTRLQHSVYQAAERIFDTAERQRPEAASRSTKLLSATRSRVPGLRFDIVRLFLSQPDTVETKLLIRHDWLNPDGVEVETHVQDELERLVSHYKNILSPCMAEYRTLRLREMILAVERGQVRPAQAVESDGGEVDKSLMAAAQRIAMARNEDVSAVYARLRAQGVRGAHLGMSRLGHGGKEYYLRDFRTLPMSDVISDQVASLGAEFLVAVLSWFRNRGLTTESYVDRIYERMAAFNPRQR